MVGTGVETDQWDFASRRGDRPGRYIETLEELYQQNMWYDKETKEMRVTLKKTIAEKDAQIAEAKQETEVLRNAVTESARAHSSSS